MNRIVLLSFSCLALLLSGRSVLGQSGCGLSQAINTRSNGVVMVTAANKYADGGLLVGAWNLRPCMYDTTPLPGCQSSCCPESYMSISRWNPATGHQRWINLTRGAYGAEYTDVQPTPDGGAIACGVHRGWMSFDGVNYFCTSTERDFFAVRFTNQGRVKWLFHGGGAKTDQPTAIRLLPNGKAVMSGFIQGIASVGPFTVRTPNANFLASFVAVLDSAGQCEKVFASAPTAIDYCAGMAVLNDSTVALHGVFAGTSVFGKDTLRSLGSNDLYVSTLTLGRGWQKTRRLGSPGVEGMGSISATAGGDILLTGSSDNDFVFQGITYPKKGLGTQFLARLAPDLSVRYVHTSGKLAGAAGLSYANALELPGGQVALGLSLQSEGGGALARGIIGRDTVKQTALVGLYFLALDARGNKINTSRLMLDSGAYLRSFKLLEGGKVLVDADGPRMALADTTLHPGQETLVVLDLNLTVPPPVTAVAKPAGGTDAAVWPVPAHNEVNLTLMESNCPYALYTAAGNLVRRGQATGKTLNLSVHSLAPGLYYLTTAGGTHRFVKE